MSKLTFTYKSIELLYLCANLNANTPMKRVRHDSCENCESTQEKCKKIEKKWSAKVEKLMEACEKHQRGEEYWRTRAEAAESKVEKHNEQYSRMPEVEDEYCCPSELKIENFAEYFENLVRKYSPLREIMNFCLSGYFTAKERKKGTFSQWKDWSGLYKAFLADTFLRSKSGKSVLRTNLLLGVMIYQSKCPESVWRILQRLKIIPSRDTIEKYLASQPKIDVSHANFVIFQYDNCDIYRHKTQRHEGNESDMLHLVSRLVFKIPRQIKVPIDKLFKPYNIEEGKKFCRFLLMDYVDQCDLAKNASELISKAVSYGGLKFAHREAAKEFSSAKLSILPAEINRQTISYDDVAKIVETLWDIMREAGELDFALFGGDWQTFTRMWHLRIKFPEKYQWLVPIPGEWHWNWHILQAIFKIWGLDLIKPFALLISHKTYDNKAQKFHYSEYLLEMITIGIAQVVEKLREKHPHKTDMRIQSLYKENSHIYELLYFWNWYLCPYWLTRTALKSGDSATINTMWRYWLPLFITAKKHNYAVMSIRFLWLMRYLDPQVASVINDFRIFSFSNAKMTGIPLDGVNELVYCVQSDFRALTHFFRR